MNTITKEVYQKFRKESKDPIEVVYKIYNYTIPATLQIKSINAFQGLLSTWLGRSKKTLIAGCLMILKKYDSKFAQ